VKIGLSYSRCVRDIVDGTVDIRDVLVIISRTDFDPRDNDQWIGIWQGYGGGQTLGSPWSNPEWNDYGPEREADFRGVTLELYESGRLHQPRQFGARPARRSEIWLEAVLPSSELESNPAAKSAWDQFQTIAGLTNVTLDKTYR
jgi:hypothetical protein